MLIEHQYPRTLGALSRSYGEGIAMAFLVVAITDFLNFFSIGNSMGETQVAQTAMLIMEDHRHLMVDDFKVFFNSCKKGKYGDTYNRIDGNVILLWLNQYEEDRAALFASRSEMEAHSLKDRYVRQATTQRASEIDICSIIHGH